MPQATEPIPFISLDGNVFHLCFLFAATTSCDSSVQFRCVASGSCIPLAFKCDHEDDCGDNSDEDHCGTCVWMNSHLIELPNIPNTIHL